MGRFRVVQERLQLGLDKRSWRSKYVSQPYDWSYFFSRWHYWWSDGDFEYHMRIHVRSVLMHCPEEYIFALSALLCSRLYAAHQSGWEGIECCRALKVPTSPVLAYYTSSVVGEHLGAAAVWRTAPIEIVTMVLVRVFCAAGRGVVEIQFFDAFMGEDGCRPLASPSPDIFIVLIMINLFPSSLTTLLMRLELIWRILAQQKSIIRLLMMHTVGFQTTLPKGMYTTWLQRLLCQRSEMEVSTRWR